jgi:flagellar motor switch protein FliN
MGQTRPRESEASLSAIEEVSVEISVVLGRTRMPIRQLLKMGRGAVIDLETTAEDDVWILANNRPIARAEILMVGEKIAVSITERLTNDNTKFGS